MRYRFQGWVLAALLLFAAGAGCSDTDLEHVPAPEVVDRWDNKIEIRGEVCTSPPEELRFPMRILFIVDTSSSMEVVDPPDPQTGETDRERAVRETWERLLDESPDGVEFGINRFDGEAMSTVALTDEDGLPTDYFTNDRDRLIEGTAALRETAATTNYLNALDEAYHQLRLELMDQRLESLPLSKYMVIFLSDGVPNVDTGAREQTDERVMAGVESIVDLMNNFGVGEFEFHTAFLSTGIATVDEAASALLEQMAEVGGGNYRGFASGAELNFLFAEFTQLRRVFSLETLGAMNENVVVDSEQIIDAEDLDTVSMGPGDTTAGSSVAVGPERRDGEEPVTPDGVTPLEPLYDYERDILGLPKEERPTLFLDITGSGAPECGEPLVDTDGDGLADMKEFYIGTDPLDRDTDRDGLSDYVEWRFRNAGLDPLDPTVSDCYVAPPCIDPQDDGLCECIYDTTGDGICDCVDDPETPCLNEYGRDCVDESGDGLCDCPDLTGDGRCDYEDRTGDGLHDCEEIYYGTSTLAVDTAGDGLPDVVEARFRTDPSSRDAEEDYSLSGVSNRQEVLANTDPRCDANHVRSEIAYQYRIEEKGQRGDQFCYDYEIGNISLVPTLPNPEERYPGNGWNRILLYTSEVPFDDTEAPGSYRFACVMARYDDEGDYRNPPSGRFELTDEDFVEVEEFDADEHCIWP